MKYLIILPILALLTNCSDGKSHRSINVRAVNACIKQGGVPVPSIWTGQIADCKFKYKEVQ